MTDSEYEYDSYGGSDVEGYDSYASCSTSDDSSGISDVEGYDSYASCSTSDDSSGISDGGDDYYVSSDGEDDSYGSSDGEDDSYGGSASGYDAYDGTDGESDSYNGSDGESGSYKGSDGESDSYKESNVESDSYKGSNVGEIAFITSAMEKGLSFNGGNSKTWRGQQSDNYQWASRGSIVDNQAGSYRRATLKESLSTGDVFKERSTGRVGYKDEMRRTSTFRAGDKGGYSEYQREERFRKVDYSGSNKSIRSSSRFTTTKYQK